MYIVHSQFFMIIPLAGKIKILVTKEKAKNLKSSLNSLNTELIEVGVTLIGI